MMIVLLALVCSTVACSKVKQGTGGQSERGVTSDAQAATAPSQSAELASIGTDEPEGTGEAGETAEPESQSGVRPNVPGASGGESASTTSTSGGTRKLAEARGSAHDDLSPGSARGVSQVQMRNVDFHVDDDVILHIKSLRGSIASKKPGTPPAFDDKHSFILGIDRGTVGMSTANLTEVMNTYVFGYPHAPIKKIVITADGDKLRLKGTVHKAIDIHIEIVGGISATSDGKISLHPTSIKADGVPVKRLMHLFGVELSGLIKQGNSRGVEIRDNDLIIDPNLIIPAPEMTGKVTSVRIEGDRVVEDYSSNNKAGAHPLIPYDRGAANYMYFRGGTIRFGKLTMTNADMQIVDLHPKGAFDFSIDHYNKQLVAGYSKNTPGYGLVVFMPDYYKLK